MSTRIHFLCDNCKPNSIGQGLGICGTFSQVTTNVEEVDCERCLKQLNEEDNDESI